MELCPDFDLKSFVEMSAELHEDFIESHLHGIVNRDIKSANIFFCEIEIRVTSVRP